MHVDLSLIVLLLRVACLNTVWLTDSIFLIFGRGHIQLTHAPPLAHARPAPPSPAAVAALQCVADLR